MSITDYIPIELNKAVLDLATPEQMRAIRAKLNESVVRIRVSKATFDLPDGYLYAIITYRGDPYDFHCGIAPDGSVSS